MKYRNILETVKLFEGFDDLESTLSSIGAMLKEVKKSEFVLLAGDRPTHIGVVLAGKFHILRENHEGSRTLISAELPGSTFGGSLCRPSIKESPVSIMAKEDSALLLIEAARIYQNAKLKENMFEIIADSNIELQNHLEIVSMKSIRAKIISYLESFTPGQDGGITIPFNREEMADYLCVDRSALSHELARMKRAELLDYKKNYFNFLGTGGLRL